MPEESLSRILGLPGYGVIHWEANDTTGNWSLPSGLPPLRRPSIGPVSLDTDLRP